MSLADAHAVRFPCEDHHLVGIFYSAQADTPAPFALLLHGLPGAEKNHDLAHFLRAQGWHVLVLHFAGGWGSEGNFSLSNQPTEAIAALDFALSPDAPAPIDPQKIVVMGYSMGSRAALFAAAPDSRIKAVISVAGFSDFSETMLSREFLEAAAPFLTGVAPTALGLQFMALGEGPQPTDAVRQIAPRQVLVVHSPEDEMVPFYHADNFGTLSNVQRATIQGASHIFGLHRTELINAIWEFLKDW
ncbi:MAG: alpha/beta fold hydrolase [Chloroflexi bacterium]|nr:alpha/beta fold hydrolase [Chloroflexota bacterium]